MHRPILCAVDQSAEALAAARLAGALARRLNAPLVLAHAIHVLPPNDGWMLLGAVPQDAHHDTQERERRRGEALLERVIDQLHLPDETEALLLVGHAGKGVLEAATSVAAAAVVVGARGHGRIRRAVLGSVSARVAASASCPVVIVPHDMDSDVPLVDGPVVCGVDGSAPAEQCATVAAAAAQRLGRELILVHVLPSALVRDEVARSEGWAILAAIARRIEKPGRLVLEPETATITTTLSEVARREGAACLMVGSRGRGALRSALLGSVSAGAAVHSPCPVVVIPRLSHPRIEQKAAGGMSQSMHRQG